MRISAAIAFWLACIAVSAGASPASALGHGLCRFPDGRGAAGTLEANGDAWLFRFDPPSIAVGEPFAVELQPCDPALQLQAVDAVMPAHRHGMNYIPRVTRTLSGYWRVERMLFHMPGLWRLQLSWRGPAGRLDAKADVTVP